MTARETTHACPPEGEALTPCCERTPFELPRGDRMTLDDSLVTCGRGRETTLGALTAADLGKRVRVGEWEDTLTWYAQSGQPPMTSMWGDRRALQLAATTPVTVYDEEEA